MIGRVGIAACCRATTTPSTRSGANTRARRASAGPRYRCTQGSRSHAELHPFADFKDAVHQVLHCESAHRQWSYKEYVLADATTRQAPWAIVGSRCAHSRFLTAGLQPGSRTRPLIARKSGSRPDQDRIRLGRHLARRVSYSRLSPMSLAGVSFGGVSFDGVPFGSVPFGDETFAGTSFGVGATGDCVDFTRLFGDGGSTFTTGGDAAAFTTGGVVFTTGGDGSAFTTGADGTAFTTGSDGSAFTTDAGGTAFTTGCAASTTGDGAATVRIAASAGSTARPASIASGAG
jgi:hypothetical protein